MATGTIHNTTIGTNEHSSSGFAGDGTEYPLEPLRCRSRFALFLFSAANFPNPISMKRFERLERLERFEQSYPFGGMW
jgi:hypothetical protein